MKWDRGKECRGDTLGTDRNPIFFHQFFQTILMMIRGDRVKLKGRKPVGVIKTMGKNDNWVRVDWDCGRQGPKFVHLYEREKVTSGDIDL